MPTTPDDEAAAETLNASHVLHGGHSIPYGSEEVPFVASEVAAPVALATTATTLPSKGARKDRLAGVLGVVGESLVTLGILLALLVVWELWWTDIGATRRQQETVAGLDWVVPAAVTPLTVPMTSTEAQAPVYVVAAAEERHGDLTAPSEPAPAYAATFATLYVPRWGFDYVKPISEGVSRKQVLDPLGVGHYPDTQLPGEVGNFAVAGHRTTYGKPFTDIETLEAGDALVVRTESTWYVYRVTKTDIVSPRFVAALAPVPGEVGAEPNESYITLTTCHPRYSAQQRYVVYGILDYWADADAGYPPELVPPGAETVEDPAALINANREVEP